MPTKIQKIPSTIWTHVRSSRIPWVPKYNAEEQTKLSWARVIESQAAVPEAYKEFFERHLADEGGFPYTVLTPSREGFMQRTTEKLVCGLGCEIYILERRGNTFEAQCYPIAGIIYVEARTVLLASSIKITGVTDKSIPASASVQFNSVTDYLFTPILNRIRNSNVDSNKSTQRSKLEDFDHWASSNFKFMNYARRSLMGEDRVIHSILQPEIRRNTVTILGKDYYKTIAPTHVIVLTNRELILIREEVTRRGGDRYGGIWDYIPLNKIAGLSLHDANDNLLLLSIQLPENTHLEFLFQESARKEINDLLYHFKELTQ